jgi:hypothetical protein
LSIVCGVLTLQDKAVQPNTTEGFFSMTNSFIRTTPMLRLEAAGHVVRLNVPLADVAGRIASGEVDSRREAP